tara:strand:- start:2950 stop:5292 length:2343 start_codon:yes stop_codon:yes gene_type:complete
MRQINFFKNSACLSVLVFFFSCQPIKYDNKFSDSVDLRVDSILSIMTLEEKIGQMTQINLTVIAKGPNKWASSFPMEIDPVKARKAIVDYKVGSVLNTINNTAQTPKAWFNTITEIQKFAMDSSRLSIPIIYGVDAIHGATYTNGATMFPQQITTAASWNPQNAYNMASVCAYETRASSIPWNFSPVLDLGMNPRFPRQFESFGEDPLLVKKFGEQMIKGYQGEDNNTSNKTKLAACMKHFVGYHATITGKDRTPAYIPDHVLKEYHITPFKTAIDAGVKTVMINSGLINGIPVHSSYKIMTEILRNQLGFEGVILTDWEDINKLCDRDKIAKNRKEATRLAINAGVDMSMVPYEYEEFIRNLIELVNEGKVKMSRIDDAVRRIIKLKLELGLFQNPTTNCEEYPDFGSDKFAKMAYESASESITLLKNKDDILPLTSNSKILVTGPNANNMRCLNGAWSYSWQGDLTDSFAINHNTIYEAFIKKYDSINIKFISGVSYKQNGSFYEMKEDNIQKAVDLAKKSDYVFLCLGENTYTEKPGDLNDLSLHELQIKFAKELSKCGKPIILILNIGRPRIITEIEPFMSAVLNIYLPGNYGADALVDIISGAVNPSGKLPYTYPAFPNSLSTYYYKPSEVQNNAQGAYNYVGEINNLYDFGYGLSYSDFEISNFTLQDDSISFSDTIFISAEVFNQSDIDGFETIQIYSSDRFALMSPDNKRLRDFKKVFVRSNSSKTVRFEIPVKDLFYVNELNEFTLESGMFDIYVGPSSNNLQKLPILINN